VFYDGHQHHDNHPPRRMARNGTLILGGGFGGAHVARLLGKAGATIVNQGTSMLYTPLLPEVAAGGIEPRHALVSLRQMCPHAELVSGTITGLDTRSRTVRVHTAFGPVELCYRRLIVALGSSARMLPIPGLAEKAMTFKTLDDAVRLRNHVLRRLDLAEADPGGAQRYLTFVFAGAGYAGVEACAEVRQMVADAWRRYPALASFRPRFVLVDAAAQILNEVPQRLSDNASRRLHRDGVEIRVGTRITEVSRDGVTLSDGTRIATDTLVWTAGVVPVPLVQRLGLPLDDRGRVIVGSTLQVAGRTDVWALGDCAAVPNAATPDRTDPPTCQHALRQARRLVHALHGRRRAYRYRSVGQGATLGRRKGIASVFGLSVRGWPAAIIVRWYHISQVPQFSRGARILTASLMSLFFGRDFAELPPVGHDPAWPAGAPPVPALQSVGASSD
jgi:NADH dehydrogenase